MIPDTPGEPVVQTLGMIMRKGALLLALVMVAVAPTASFAAAKKSKAPSDPNAAGQKLVYNGMMQPYYAWQSIWVAKPAKKK
jgi:opacity protein-like surface antigen